jgi:hypothetical protein
MVSAPRRVLRARTAAYYGSALLVAAASACDTSYSSGANGDGTDGGDDASAAQVTDASGSVSSDAKSTSSDAGTLDGARPPFEGGAPPQVFVELGSRLRLWLDATDKSTIALSNGNTVTTWTDKSALKLVATAQLGTVAWANDADAGGAGAITLAAGAYLSIPNNAAFNFASEAFSAWAVVRFAAADVGAQNNNTLSMLGAGTAMGPTGYAFTIHVQGAGPQVCGFFNAQTCAPATEGFGTFAYELGALATNQTLTVQQIGGAPTTTTGKLAPSANPLLIGATQGGMLPFHGSIYEIVIASAPSASESTAIVAYLSNKYGR